MSFLTAVEHGASHPGSEVHPDFEMKLEHLAKIAEKRVTPIQFRGRLIAALAVTVTAAAGIFGNLIPTAREAVGWYLSLGHEGLVITLLAASAILLLSSPLLIWHSRNRMEES